MKYTYLAILVIISLCMLSCEKDEVAITLKSKLINKNWKSSSFLLDEINQDKWCWKNSIYNFYEDGNIFITEGDNEGACFGTVIGRIRKYKYNISADEKLIIIQFNPSLNDAVDSFMVQTINETQLSTKRIVNKDTPIPNTWEDGFTVLP